MLAGLSNLLDWNLPADKLRASNLPASWLAVNIKLCQPAHSSNVLYDGPSLPLVAPPDTVRVCLTTNFAKRHD